MTDPMSTLKQKIELRGALVIDQMQPQFAATVAVSSDGYFPVAGQCAFWLETHPAIVVNSLLDVALKSCEVRPGALITERSYGSFEVHAHDQGQVREARRRVLEAAGLKVEDGLRPQVLIHEIIRQIDDHQATLVNRSRTGMLVLGQETLYTLEVSPAIWVLLAANEAEKAAPVRLIGLENNGAVGRLRLAGSDAEIEAAVQRIELVLAEVPGRAHGGDS